ncbi:hypothetical protein DXB61_05415 [Parabacteroides merdae]|uniref:Transposase IS204/IS1001/IS1096/IS1165 zinc-finger domain-containing protein n=1 Tax=Parabacteroides merdae TaxID=46503 RepID=A0AB37LXH2_9BACT|nr:hypothetical protein [Parabacteroides merdae]RGN52986.1 hypothetical protein DXB61_05415 [Parabacteroides merdae]
MKGHYLCSLQGLEIAGHPLTLMVNVRKFRCRNIACQRKVFSEPLSLAGFFARAKYPESGGTHPEHILEDHFPYRR